LNPQDSFWKRFSRRAAENALGIAAGYAVSVWAARAWLTSVRMNWPALLLAVALPYFWTALVVYGELLPFARSPRARAARPLIAVCLTVALVIAAELFLRRALQ
jgi:hypothetical protein